MKVFAFIINTAILLWNYVRGRETSVSSFTGINQAVFNSIHPSNWGSIQRDSRSVGTPECVHKIIGGYMLSLVYRLIDGKTHQSLLDKLAGKSPEWERRNLAGAEIATRTYREWAGEAMPKLNLGSFAGLVDWRMVKSGSLAGFWFISETFEFDWEVWGYTKAKWYRRWMLWIKAFCAEGFTMEDTTGLYKELVYEWERIPRLRVSVHWGSKRAEDRHTYSFGLPIPKEHFSKYEAKFENGWTKAYINDQLVFMFPVEPKDKGVIVASMYGLVDNAEVPSWMSIKDVRYTEK